MNIYDPKQWGWALQTHTATSHLTTGVWWSVCGNWPTWWNPHKVLLSTALYCNMRVWIIFVRGKTVQQRDITSKLWATFQRERVWGDTDFCCTALKSIQRAHRRLLRIRKCWLISNKYMIDILYWTIQTMKWSGQSGCCTTLSKVNTSLFCYEIQH